MENGELDETFAVETELNPPQEEEAPPWLGHQRRMVAASPTESLLMKLDMWLLQQPEFLFLITSANRATRREAAQLISKHIMSYPMRGKAFGGLSP